MAATVLGRTEQSSPEAAPRRAPLGAGLCEVKQFERRFVIREAAAGLDDFAQAAVQRLDRVGGVDHLADARRESEKRGDLLPRPAPSLADRRITLAPFGLELVEPNASHVGSLGPIDRLERRQDRFAILPGDESQAIPD